MSAFGPRLSNVVLQQVGSYLGYTGPGANPFGKAARDPTRTSALRHPGQPHALNRAVAPGKEGRIVAACIRAITKATNGEAWIERKSRLRRGPRLVQLPEPHQRSREKEMRCGIISV